MLVKLIDSKSFSVESPDNAVKSIVTLTEDGITARVENGVKKSLEISKPGEYEAGSMSIVALEVPVDDSFSSRVDFLTIEVEHTKIAVLAYPIDLKHEILKGVEEVKMVLLPQIPQDFIRETIKYFEPDKIAILSTIGKTPFVTLSDLTKIVANTIESSQLKFKESDFPTSLSENKTISGYYLSK